MAVGFANDNNGILAQWWNGSSWRVVDPLSAPGGYELFGVSCTSAAYCMAVGVDQEGPASYPISAIWNGTSWRLGSPPSRGENDNLAAVSCRSASSCMAVGYWSSIPDSPGVAGLAERWNGASWNVLPLPAPAGDDLTGISCPGSSHCLAIGTARKNWLAERWNGSAWKKLTLPASGGLPGLSCVTAAACVAVGGQGKAAWPRPGTAAPGEP